MPKDETPNINEILSDLARAKCVFQGRAIAAAMGDMAATGTGFMRLTVDGVEHITPAEVIGDFRCYGCDRRFPARMASTDIKDGSAYCAHCEDYDYHTSDPGDDREDEE